MWIDDKKRVYEARIYFKDFYGKPDSLTICIRLDITEFDKIYLPTVERQLLHPYSDADKCKSALKCMKLEEILAGLDNQTPEYKKIRRPVNL